MEWGSRQMEVQQSFFGFVFFLEAADKNQKNIYLKLNI